MLQWMILLKPDFKCSKSFVMYWGDIVTKRFVSITTNIQGPVELLKTQLVQHVNIISISQLIKGFSRDY